MSNFNYSIIIPHYNIPNLLIRCLKSIPVREDIQVIVIDDCSPGAEKYLDLYPELSRPYLEYYNTQKGGSAGRARNIGLEHAKGNWLIFLDSDDLFVDEAEFILNEIKEKTEDIVFFNSVSVKSDDLSQKSNRNFYNHYFEDYAIDHDEKPFRYNFHSLWGKIIKNKLVQNYKIKFDETRYSNDVFFSCVIGHYAKEIAIVNKPLFIVTEREGSLASSQFSNKIISLKECLDRFNVAFKTRLFIDKCGVRVYSYQIFEYSEKLRDNYPWEYIKLMAKLFFFHPYYSIQLGQRDLKFFFKRIFCE